jgi:hypothetical protein
MRTEEEIKSDIEKVNKCLNPLSLYKTEYLVKELSGRSDITFWELAYHESDDFYFQGPAKIILMKERE